MLDLTLQQVPDVQKGMWEISFSAFQVQVEKNEYYCLSYQRKYV